VRELDRYHGFVAAERWGLPNAPEPLGEADAQIIAQLVDRIRGTSPRPKKIESAPGNGVAPETPRPLDPAPQRDGALASGFEPVGAPPARSQMAPQEVEKIESAPGNGMASETADPPDMVGGRDGAFASALDPAGQTPLIVEPPPAGSQMSPQGLEKIESGLGNGRASEAADPQDAVRGRDGARASALEGASRGDPASARRDPSST